MPRGDGTGPDGKGPKSKNKGWPERYDKPERKSEEGKCLRKRDGNCQVDTQDSSDE